jgi:hypothetical protein
MLMHVMISGPGASIAMEGAKASLFNTHAK